MNEFDYLIFVNDAKEPIAGFAFRDHAIAWVNAQRWGRSQKAEIRETAAEQPDGGHPLHGLPVNRPCTVRGQEREICGVICNCGPNDEPIACGHAPDHAGAHSWAALPTFAEQPDRDHPSGVEGGTIDNLIKLNAEEEWTKEELEDSLRAMGIGPDDILRRTAQYKTEHRAICPKCNKPVRTRLTEHGREPDKMMIPCEGSNQVVVNDNGVTKLLALIDDLTDPDECWFDHLGHCQAHSWLSKEPCPHGLAQEILRRTRSIAPPRATADARPDCGAADAESERRNVLRQTTPEA